MALIVTDSLTDTAIDVAIAGAIVVGAVAVGVWAYRRFSALDTNVLGKDIQRFLSADSMMRMGQNDGMSKGSQPQFRSVWNKLLDKLDERTHYWQTVRANLVKRQGKWYSLFSVKSLLLQIEQVDSNLRAIGSVKAQTLKGVQRIEAAWESYRQGFILGREQQHAFTHPDHQVRLRVQPGRDVATVDQVQVECAEWAKLRGEHDLAVFEVEKEYEVRRAELEDGARRRIEMLSSAVPAAPAAPAAPVVSPDVSTVVGSPTRDTARARVRARRANLVRFGNTGDRVVDDVTTTA